MSNKNNKINHWTISKKTTILNHKFWFNLFLITLAVGLCLLIVAFFSNVNYNKTQIQPDSFDGFILSSGAKNIYELGFFSEASNRIMEYVSVKSESSNLLSLHIVGIIGISLMSLSALFSGLSIYRYIKAPKSERTRILKDINYDSLTSFRDYSQDIL